MTTMINVGGKEVTVDQFYAALYWGRCYRWFSGKLITIFFLRGYRLRCVYGVRTVIHRAFIQRADFLASLVGISVVQGYLYFTTNNKDRWSIKALVSFVTSVLYRGTTNSIC